MHCFICGVVHYDYTGLANRVVPVGESLKRAVQLAQQIASFPQKCLQKDFLSARSSAFSGKTMEELLRLELEGSEAVLNQESLNGAQRFVEGEGRGGEGSGE